MVKSNIEMWKEQNLNNAIVIGRCFNCKFWERQKDNDCSKNMGVCSLLSGKFIDKKDEYPDTEKTGIESYPICVYDGAGFYYETKEWFGCVGHNAL